MKRFLLLNCLTLLISFAGKTQTVNLPYYYRNFHRIDVLNGGTWGKRLDNTHDLYTHSWHGGTNQQFTIMPMWIKAVNGTIQTSTDTL